MVKVRQVSRGWSSAPSRRWQRLRADERALTVTGQILRTVHIRACGRKARSLARGHRALAPPKAATDPDCEGRWLSWQRTHVSGHRDKAVRQLKKRRDFYGHLLIYVLFNAFRW